MATAYLHLKPFARLISFIGDTIRETKESIYSLERELQMWQEPEIRKMLNLAKGEDEQFRRYVNDRVVELMNRITELCNLLFFWQEFWKFVNPCQKCTGRGEVVDPKDDDPDRVIFMTCPECKGEGRQKTAQAGL